VPKGQQGGGYIKRGQARQRKEPPVGVPRIATSHWMRHWLARKTFIVRTSCSVDDTVHRYQVVLTLTLTTMTGVVHHDAAAVRQLI
jgi:hypothetical protein